MTTTEPGSLAAALAAGHPQALEACYTQLRPTVLSFLHRYVPPSEAEDVLQRVFVDVWRSAGRYDPTRSLEAWVLTIARRRAIDYLRARDTRALPTDEFADVPGEDGRYMVDGHAQSEVMATSMQRLSPEHREVLELAYFRGYTQTEISKHLGLPLGTVKTRTARGLRKLADFLRRDDVL